jgi:alkylated DNA repair protein alkB family protein 1
MSDPARKDGTTHSTSAFKRAQLRYRRQGADPNRIDCQNEFLDFSNSDGDGRIIPIQVNNTKEDDAYQGPMYGIKSVPGFIFAPQALSPKLQSKIAYMSVTEFCERPHTTNIDKVPITPNEDQNLDQSMWDLYVTDFGRESRQSTTQKRKPYKTFKKLAWATMGWHYDWTARAYHDDAQSPMPTILADLAQPFAKASLLMDNAASTDFLPSAAIVNYYTLKSTMGGHCDDLEFALDKPVVSLSVGLSGVFLLGGGTSSQDSPVLPILVRSGDVMILGGDARLRYHGMARVLPPSETTTLDLSSIPVQARIYLESFVSQHRININVRQVLPDGVKSIAEAQEEHARVRDTKSEPTGT